MGAKKNRQARATAYTEAKRIDLWAKGEELWYAKRYRRLLARILPAIKKRYDAIIGRWYKANLAHFEEVAKDTKTENEYSEYLKVRARLETAHYKARQEAGRIHVKTSR